MIQSVLMLLAPAGRMSEIPIRRPASSRPMATQVPLSVAGSRYRRISDALAVAGNALGLLLYMAGIALVLRLAEVLLN